MPTPLERRRDLTLLELIIVMLILAALAGTIVPLFGDTISTTKRDATRAKLQDLRNAIMGTPEQPGYYSDMRDFEIVDATDTSRPFTLVDLFQKPDFGPSDDRGTYNPVTKRGWNGPYITQLETVGNTVGIFDGYLKEIKVQVTMGGALVRLVSGGPDEEIDTDETDATAQDDDVVLILFDRTS